jgi:hypothetical protein
MTIEQFQFQTNRDLAALGSYMGSLGVLRLGRTPSLRMTAVTFRMRPEVCSLATAAWRLEPIPAPAAWRLTTAAYPGSAMRTVSTGQGALATTS